MSQNKILGKKKANLNFFTKQLEWKPMLTAFQGCVLHPGSLKVGPQLHKEDPEGVDDPEDDPVAREAAHHHQPRLHHHQHHHAYVGTCSC